MLFHLVGASHQLSRKVSWPVVLSFSLLFVPVALSQKPVVNPKTPEEAHDLETAQETNDRITALALAESARQGDYIIGSGDLLDIEIFDVPELSREIRVNETGLISLPLIPVKIHAAGLTPFQLQDKVAELLQVNGLVTTPQVTVSVKEEHSDPITIIGAVRNPMVIQAVRQMTLLEVLSQAGGIADDAGDRVMVTRADPPGEPDKNAFGTGSAQTSSISIKLNDLLDSGNPKYNIPVLGGDVVSVPRAGVVYAVGAVQHAGGFVMHDDREQMTVLKVLSLSGGLAPAAKPEDAVIIRRPATGGPRQEVRVNLKKILELKSEDVALRQNDILFVPDSSGKRALTKAAGIAISLATGVAIIRASR
jgi:polysaccharide biosynthesis/export protein